MAKDNDDAWKRYREKEDERERGESVSGPQANKAILTSDRVTQLVEQAEPLIEQVNNLYNQFMSGIERLPPEARRKQLDDMMGSITTMPKPTPAVQFRCNTLTAHYKTYAEKWDKLLRDLEAGKIQRRKG